MTSPMSTPIDSFTGQYRFLSNFWPAEVVLGLLGRTYPTVEHAYQAAKSNDGEYQLRVSSCATPGEAKRLGRNADLRPDWRQEKVETMEYLVRQKFSHPDLRARLLATSDRELIEGNTWGDRFWGKCKGVGQNHLGKILMKVRDELRVRDNTQGALLTLGEWEDEDE